MTPTCLWLRKVGPLTHSYTESSIIFKEKNVHLISLFLVLCLSFQLLSTPSLSSSYSSSLPSPLFFPFFSSISPRQIFLSFLLSPPLIFFLFLLFNTLLSSTFFMPSLLLPCLPPLSSPLVLTTPSSWSLDSGTREALPFLSAHVGSVMAPPIPPRNLAHGTTLLLHACVIFM